MHWWPSTPSEVFNIHLYITNQHQFLLTNCDIQLNIQNHSLPVIIQVHEYVKLELNSTFFWKEGSPYSHNSWITMILVQGASAQL